MRVLYDHFIFAMQRYGGVSRYYSELLPHLSATGVDVLLFMGMHMNAYDLATHSHDFARFWGFRRPITHGTHRLTVGLNNWLLHRFARRQTFDLFHATSYRDTLPDFSGRRVLTVHDLVAERLSFPPTTGAHPWRLSPKVVSHTHGFICVSQNTQCDLLHYYNVSIERTCVIHHANSLTMPPGPKPVNYPYILHVGGRGGYKNFTTLLRAYAQSRRLRDNFHLICFGHALTPEELRQADNLHIINHIHHMGGPDQILVDLYAYAAAFVYPSLYEGFGIPLLEAMHYGCPVVAARASCFPEIAADAAIYFDPNNPAELADCLERVLTDNVLRNQLVKTGRQREMQFSWDRAARQTMEFYRSVLAK